MDLQEFIRAAAVICNVFEEIELLLLSPGANDQPIEEKPLLELNIFNRASLNLMITPTKHSFRDKHQTVVIDLKVTN